jgi:hypothetical protein
MMNVSFLLWRGELRAQRLVSRRIGISICQIVSAVGLLAFLAFRVRSLILKGGLPTTNIGVLSIAGTLIILANVGVVGHESGASVSDIRGWARPLPVSASQLRQLLVATGLFRSMLFTVTLIGAVAAAALSVSPTWTARAEIGCAAILLPILPVAAGLWLGARRSRPASPGFVTAPLGAAFMAIVFPFPLFAGPVGGAVRALATPGLTLLGRASPVEAVTMFVLWIIVSMWFLLQLENEETTSLSDTPPLAWRLARSDERGVAVDLVLHRLRGRDVGEVLLLSVMLVVTAFAQLAFGGVGTSPAATFVVVLLASSAASVGYNHVRTATTFPHGAEMWVQAMPIPRGTVPWVRHLFATVGAGLAALVFVVCLTAGAFAGLAVAPAAVAAVVVTPWSLGGWIGLCARVNGLRRLLAFACLGQLIFVRAGTVFVIALLGCSLPAGLLLLGADLALGLIGHLTFRHNTRKR